MSEAIVASTSQTDIEIAKVAAGIGGTVVFPEGLYLVGDLKSDIDGQSWVFRSGASLKRSGGTKPLLQLMCSSTTIDGGKFDVSGGSFDSAKPFAICGVGAALKWTGGELCNSPAWGIQMDDGLLELDRVHFHHLAYAVVHWRAMTNKTSMPGDYRDGPKITRCRIDRRDGYVSSGGVLVNSGGGTKSCYRARVEACDIIMPVSENYDNVGVEFTLVELGKMVGNTLDGSRIGFSAASCSQLDMSHNGSKNVSNYAHELVNGEWSVITANQASGVGSSTPGIGGIVVSGTSRANIVANNVTKVGFPTSVRDVSTWVPGYSSLIVNNL